ncbi:MAG: T9SS type A sorting domain-containing protein [Gemmatimonadales bacterium]
MSRSYSWLVALLLLVAAPPVASGQKPPSVRLQSARASGSGAFTATNRVYHGVSTDGTIGPGLCCDFIYGSSWPGRSADVYLYNSGFQVAGIVGGARSPSNPWGGDTTGGFFFDPKGTTEHGIGLTDLFDASVPADVANWPTEALVPATGATSLLFDPLLRRRISASQNDFWFMNWEGDPGVNAGRSHPLGIATETRVMAWNYPVGNEDVVYFLVTFYNITSANAADYAGYSSGLRARLLAAGVKFQQLNNTKFTVTLPVGGYAIDQFHLGFGADPDVASAGSNFSSISLPFAMGMAWDARFNPPASWKFDPTIFGTPFTPAPGLIGMQFLDTPTDKGVRLYSNFSSGGAFPDPSNVNRLFRYLSGAVGPAAGTVCNTGDPVVSHVCYLASAPSDIRFMQSRGPYALAPGQSVSMVLATVFAAPVALPSLLPGVSTVPPGDPTRMTNAATLASSGANQIDSISGFTGYTDVNGDGVVQGREIRTVPRSLLAKAQLAQAIFDAKFLLPSAPDAPEFFLIPGDDKVTVVWKPSATEVNGDPYFESARNAAVVPSGGGAVVPNPLYDPNFRKFDVLGYRIFRGRTDNPGAMTLVAEFDQSGTFDDYDGRVPVGIACAPEFNLTTSCPGAFDPIVAGIARTRKRSYRITSELKQVRLGDRVRLDSGDLIALKVDTAGHGLAPSVKQIGGDGVPFVFRDSDVRNGSSYYYAVTAYDYNSIQSGPTSLESPRLAKRVVPLITASNLAQSGTTESGIYGRGARLTDDVAPTLDPVTGRFSKRALPANGLTLRLAAIASELLKGPGEVSMRHDSVTIGAQIDVVSQQATWHFTLTGAAGVVKLSVPFDVSLTTAPSATQGLFAAVAADPALSAQYGGGAGYATNAEYFIQVPSGYYTTVRGRGCVNGAGGYAGISCFYNGPRWFVGDNETRDNPNSANAGTSNTNLTTTDFNNVGAVPPGVATLHEPVAYSDRLGSQWRQVQGALAPFVAAADYRLFWGSNWAIDSVIDLTHDVAVPFSPRIGATWGVLNAGAVAAGQSFDQRAALTASDISCVEPLKSLAAVQLQLPCSGTAVLLSSTVTLGQVVFDHAAAGNSVDRTANVAPNPGFILYLKGHEFLIAMSDLSPPPKGTAWTVRDYVGAINGGNGAAGNGGSYVFSTQNMPRPLTAAGASLRIKYDFTNELRPSTADILSGVHTVPDPYYINRDVVDVPIRFVHLPAKATIRIYSSAGRLLRVLQHQSETFGGETNWDLRTRENKYVASGIYFYHVTAENGASIVGRLTVVHQLR